MEFPTLSDDMKPADAFAIAMKSEEMAVMRYTILSEGCGDPEQSKVFDNLAAMEKEHKFKMEQAFVNTAYPEVWWLVTLNTMEKYYEYMEMRTMRL